MKRLLWLLLLLPLRLHGQSAFAFYQFPSPLPRATFYVCPLQAPTNPCSAPVNIYKDSALTQLVSQPVTLGIDGNFGFYTNPGQYTIQVQSPYNLVYNISIGTGSSGSINNNAGGGGQVGYYATNGVVISPDACTTGSGNMNCNSFTTGGAGTGIVTFLNGVAPSNPATGKSSLYVDSTTKQTTCLTSVNGACIADSHSFNAFSYGLWSGDSSTTITCNSTSGSNQLACSGGIGDFKVGHYVFMPGAGPACGTAVNTTCTAPSFTVSNVGTAGITTYNYVVAAVDSFIGIGTGSTVVSTTTGNATLSNSNFNRIRVNSPTQTAATYAVWCNNNFVGTFSPTNTNSNGPALYDDRACTATTPPLGIPTAPPGGNVNEALSAQITAISGTTLTVSVNAGATVTGGTVAHDDAPLAQLAITNASAGATVLLPPVMHLIHTPLKISCTASNVTIDGRGTIFDGQYPGIILQICNLPEAVNRAENITIQGLRINGAAQPFNYGNPSRIPTERAFGGQVGEEADGEIALRHVHTAIYNVPGAAYVLGKGTAGFAEQIVFDSVVVRFIGGPCISTNSGPALDDVSSRSSVYNNCGDMASNALNADYGCVYIAAASYAGTMDEYSACRNQDNVNGYLSGVVLRNGNAALSKEHLEVNGANQVGSRDLFLDTESASLIAATDCSANSTLAAQTCIQSNSPSTRIFGVNNEGGSNHQYTNIVDVSASTATDFDVEGVSNQQCTSCAPLSNYVSIAGTNPLGKVGPTPADTHTYYYTPFTIPSPNAFTVGFSSGASNTPVQIDNGVTSGASTTNLRLSATKDFGRSIWLFSTDGTSNTNDFTQFGVDGFNDALKITNATSANGGGVLQGKYGVSTIATTFGSIQACSGTTEGVNRAISDAGTNVNGAIISSGGGSNHVNVYCNGSNWIVGSGTAGYSASGAGSTTAIAANTCAQALSITVSGATTSMVAVASGQGSLPTSGLTMFAAVTAANTVTVQYCNVTTGSITPAALTIQVRVIP